MGRNTKKFIDKKKAATFQLMSRDSTDPEFSDAPGCDRVFVRVDNNPYSIHSFNPEADADSIFADAPEDCDGVEGARVAASSAPAGHGRLPDHVRKEIIELGFPDDGYNYLLHMREIRNTGGGSAFYENPKTRLDLVPKDVKAYDASRVPIAQASDDSNDASIYNVASRSVNVRVQKALDPEIAALLDDTDLSRFGSDVEDLEEDFVVQANVPDGEEEEDAMDRSLHSLRISETSDRNSVHQEELFGHGHTNGNKNIIGESNYFPTDDKPRARRLIDEQFDTLASQEYGSEDEDDYYNDYSDKEDEPLAEKLKNTINSNVIDDFDIDGDYKAPADLLHDNDQVQNKELQESAANLINRCMEYAEKYEEETDDREVVFEEESSDESEVWDCETIVSTYSNLENHPAKIGAPARKKRLAGTVPAVAALLASGQVNNAQVITLKGKQKLPVEFMPQSRKDSVEKVKSGSSGLKPEPVKTRQHGQESKEEKKERKSAVKEERREARRLKKEMKGLYRGEAHRAQKVAAITGPSAIPLM